MKEGDIVFHFNGKKIIEGVVYHLPENFSYNGHPLVDCFFPNERHEESVPVHRHGEYFPSAILGEEVFDSKKNLQKYFLEKLEIPKDDIETFLKYYENKESTID